MSDWLQKTYSPESSDKLPVPSERPSTSITVRIFERESDLKHVIKTEFVRQLDELVQCNYDGCTFRYVVEEESDPAVRMLIHHYLHLARDADDKVKKATLDKLLELIDPPKGRVTTGEIAGVLTAEDREALQLEDGE